MRLFRGGSEIKKHPGKSRHCTTTSASEKRLNVLFSLLFRLFAVRSSDNLCNAALRGKDLSVSLRPRASAPHCETRHTVISPPSKPH